MPVRKSSPVARSARDPFREDVLRGLGARPKTLPCKYFYDRRGSQLFDRICELDEYYLTRTETWIMRHYAPEMVQAFGPQWVLIELGSGSSIKTRQLLDQSPRPAAYVPVDIAASHLAHSAQAIARDYPDVHVVPRVADFARPFSLSSSRLPGGRRIVYFPGSTIGNFDHRQADALLRRMYRLAGPGGGLLIGIDLVKSPEVLAAAYDDRSGVTARFNRNLLRRINRELGGTFVVSRFRHRAIWNAAQERMEMYLESRMEQVAQVSGRTFRFSAGERIHTENSHKYRLATFLDMARQAGYTPHAVWTDPRKWFAVILFNR